MNILRSACKFSKALIAIGILLLLVGVFFCKPSSGVAAASPDISDEKEEVSQDSDFPFPIIDDSTEQNIRIQQHSIKHKLIRIQKKLEKRKERKNATTRSSK